MKIKKKLVVAIGATLIVLVMGMSLLYEPHQLLVDAARFLLCYKSSS